MARSMMHIHHLLVSGAGAESWPGGARKSTAALDDVWF